MKDNGHRRLGAQPGGLTSGFALHLVLNLPEAVSITSSRRNPPTFMLTCDTHAASHTRTVVRECCKGDYQSQWERGKFDPRYPKTPQPMFTKICVGDWVGDIYYHAIFFTNRFRGFGSAHAWFRASRHKVTRLLFIGVLEKGYSRDERTDFDVNTSNDAVPRREVPFGGRETNI